MQKSNLPRITDVANLAGKRVFVRSSLNVPVEDGKVIDHFRLMRGLATVNFLTDKGAKVILAGHIGRDPEDTLVPVFHELQRSIKLTFVGKADGADARAALEHMQNGEVVMLENLRQDPREKENDPAFVDMLASFADLYVNDAFPNSHRSHASMVGLPARLPAYVGLNFAHEYEELAKALEPENPALFLLGGAKFETKLPLVAKFLKVYDHVFIGGALAHDFFKAKGYELGTSLVSDADVAGQGLVDHPKILLPVDVTVKNESGIRVTQPDKVEKGDCIVDAGPETIKMLEPYIGNAKTILWNGPFGNYEQGFSKETERCAALIAEAEGYSIVGGGDTVASISAQNVEERFDFLSTAGGAMLTFLEEGTLPSIEALTDSKH